jgi:hypothetical protein
VIYTKEGKINMFVYDVIAGIKRFQQPIEGFEQVVDAGFMLDANTLLFSAVRKGQTDIFTYRIDNQKSKQITNDVYDDLDPSVVSFPNRIGIIFASNRPGINASNADTVYRAIIISIFFLPTFSTTANSNKSLNLRM